MEPLTLFSVTVGLISSIRLVSTTFKRVGKGRYNQGNLQAKRKDWYCFFQPSDLLGKNWNTNQKRNNQSTHHRC